ncbi:hypothetical protein [Rhizobium leguminosarum]|uniref:hypothetical protein n=1 Tax=Rhizobium leguminosarum TaxID=384 RepID=UPI00103AA545|nr:hypothetical protein [Rhizobium leguminosarum]TCA57162.1 hypothetical protein E0H41_26525 [Rhizobium leguminosarum bv. viciae]TCB22081.1 hypothetical protein E0J09_25865 [Rhizobium leguminosarum bv. viciae]
MDKFEASALAGFIQQKLSELEVFMVRGLREGSLHYFRGKLDRQQALDALGLSPKSDVGKLIDTAVDAFDARAVLEGYAMQPGMLPIYLSPGSQRQRVFDAIKESMDDGDIVWSNKGIHRGPIAAKLGIGETNLTFHRIVFEYFEDGHGDRDDRVERDQALDELVEAAIQDSIKGRAVDVVAGKLQHRALIRERIPEAFAKPRRPRTLAIFKKYDRIAIDSGYSRRSKDEVLARLSDLLDAGEFFNPLKGTVNRTRLEAKLGIPTLFKEAEALVSKFEQENRDRLRVDPYVAAIEDTFFPFADLISTRFPDHFVEKLTKGFRQSYSDLGADRARAHYRELMKLMSWLKEQKGLLATIAESLQVRGRVKDADWLYALLQYHDSAPESGRRALVASLNNLTRKLSAHGIFPWLANGISKGPRRAASTIKSFAEVAAQSSTDHERNVDDFMTFIEGLANSDNLSLFAESERLDSMDFFYALKQDFLINGREGPLEVVQATRTIIEKRQFAFNERFNSLIDAGIQRLEEGDALAAQGVDPALYWEKLRDPSLTQGERNRLTRTYFPHPDTEDRVALKNLLRLVRDVFKRAAPNADETNYTFFQKRYQETAKYSEVQNYLLPSNAMMSACASIYFQGSGVNLPVGRKLLEDCYQDCDDKNFRKVIGFKATARGRPIIYYFEQKSDEVRALDAAKKWGKYLRDIAPPAYKNFMFLQKVGARIEPLHQHALLSFFHAQRKSIDSLENVPLTPRMWRPTLTLLCAIDSGGKLATALAMAQHTEGVSGHYYDRFPLRLMHELRLRHFKELLEAAVVHSVPGAAAYISLDPKLLEKRLSEAIDVGIGIACADPYARSDDKRSMCNSLDCFRCKQMMIAIDAESLSWLIIWKSSLEHAEGDWIRDHPDRWEHEFLPFICLVEVVEELMSSAMFLPIWHEAEDIAGERLCDPDFHPYQPWS